MGESNPILNFINENPPKGEFKPHAIFSNVSDSLTFYFRNDPDYAERLNSRVTVYYSMEDNQLVGCRIKSVKRVLEDIGSFPVEINHEGSRVSMLFLAFRGQAFDSEKARKIWKTLVEQSKNVEGPIISDDGVSQCAPA